MRTAHRIGIYYDRILLILLLCERNMLVLWFNVIYNNR